jgi:CDP-glycerol glycerophosphotransferase (TagB/SpsB family)
MIERIIRSRKLKALVLGVLDPFFMKNSNKILFVVKDRTYFSGNLRVVCEQYLKENHTQLYVYKDGQCQKEIKEELESLGVIVLDGFSFVSAFHILTSGVLVLSHNPRDAHISKKFKSRKIINLWHGVAIKRIENLMPDIPIQKQKQLDNNSKLYDMVIASSEQDKKTNAKAFGVDEKSVKITGLPRYEILKNDYQLGKVLKKESQKIEEIKAGRKLILFAPTFRESNISAIEQISDNEWRVLELFVKENNLLFGIRPHPYDIKHMPSIVKESEHFYLFQSAKFTEPNIMLKLTDVLIVDFTSIWIDYLLLERPIIGFAKDYKYYLEEERGFVYDFNVIFPTSFVDSIENLIEEIKKVNLTDTPIRYDYVTNVLHEYDIKHNFAEDIYEQIELVRADG